MVGWRHKELFKGPMHKFSFVVTYPGFQQRKEQSVLETPEERLGTEALGREQRVAAGIPVLSHLPKSGSPRAQADHSLLSDSSWRGNNSPTPERDSAPAFWCMSLTIVCRVKR